MSQKFTMKIITIEWWVPLTIWFMDGGLFLVGTWLLFVSLGFFSSPTFSSFPLPLSFWYENSSENPTPLFLCDFYIANSLSNNELLSITLAFDFNFITSYFNFPHSSIFRLSVSFKIYFTFSLSSICSFRLTTVSFTCFNCLLNSLCISLNSQIWSLSFLTHSFYTLIFSFNSSFLDSTLSRSSMVIFNFSSE